jgi:hypothetical protein
MWIHDRFAVRSNYDIAHKRITYGATKAPARYFRPIRVDSLQPPINSRPHNGIAGESNRSFHPLSYLYLSINTHTTTPWVAEVDVPGLVLENVIILTGITHHEAANYRPL